MARMGHCRLGQPLPTMAESTARPRDARGAKQTHSGTENLGAGPLGVAMATMPLVGDEFAGYRLLSVLGRGGMSVVYQAENPRLGSVVALKVLAPELADDDIFRARFLQESRTAAGLNHPHVIPIHDMGSAGDLLFIAMRYVSGADLRSLLRAHRRLTPTQALLLTGQTGRALDFAHAHDLVHRDIKPANILVERAVEDDEPDHVYLADFGITKHALSRSGLTPTGQFMGTLDYVAPEQIQGRAVDKHADIYSLGCVLFECLTGQVPFVKDVDAAVLWAHVEETAPHPSDLRAGLPPGIDAVLDRALAKHPEDRYDSCKDLTTAARTAFGNPGPGSRGASCATSATCWGVEIRPPRRAGCRRRRSRPRGRCHCRSSRTRGRRPVRPGLSPRAWRPASTGCFGGSRDSS